MLTTLQGIYRKGKIVLKDNPSNIPDENSRHCDLSRRGGD